MQNSIQNLSPFLYFVSDAVCNIKEWLAARLEQLHDQTQPKCFKFIRNAAGKCDFLSKLFPRTMGRSRSYFKGTAMAFIIFSKVFKTLSC